MSGATSPAAAFGRTLGEAARGAQVLHYRALAESGSDFPAWVVFTLLNERGGRAARDWLETDLATRLSQPREVVAEHIDRMIATDHLRCDDVSPEMQLVVTDRGRKHFSRSRERVAQLTSQLLGGIEDDDVAAAVRVLKTVNDRARHLIAVDSVPA